MPNRFQRWYFAWAERRYARMAPEVREQARAIDCWLYSRRGVPGWIGLCAAVAATAWGLHATGLGAAEAVVIGAVLVTVVAMAALGAWLTPDRFSGPRLWRVAWIMLLGSYAGVFSTVVVRGRFPLDEPQHWPQTIALVAWAATPFQLIAGLAMLFVMWVTATSRRAALQRQLARTRLEQERDQARLQLLQAQIQPHFLFNTLATLQHWVDTGDARAAPLLRQLTAFLRGSTELLGRPGVTLAEEADTVARYLEIMAARLGPRLAWRLDIDPAAAGQVLPPGLLVTLVENAVEHGIEPALRGGCIEVAARREAGAFVLEVRDDGAGLAPGHHDGTGLANGRARLAHAFGTRASFDLAPRAGGPGTLARIRIDDAP